MSTMLSSTTGNRLRPIAKHGGHNARREGRRIRDVSPHGVWAVSDKGRQWLKEQR